MHATRAERGDGSPRPIAPEPCDETYHRHECIEEAPLPIIMHAEDGEVLQVGRTWGS